MNKINVKLEKRDVKLLITLLNAIIKKLPQPENYSLDIQVVNELAIQDMSEDVRNLNYLLEKKSNKKNINFSLNKITLLVISALRNNEVFQFCFDDANFFMIMDVINKIFIDAEVFLKRPKRP